MKIQVSRPHLKSTGSECKELGPKCVCSHGHPPVTATGGPSLGNKPLRARSAGLIVLEFEL